MKPVQCPSKKCHSPYWDIERRVQESKDADGGVVTNAAEVGLDTEPKKIISGKHDPVLVPWDDA